MPRSHQLFLRRVAGVALALTAALSVAASASAQTPQRDDRTSRWGFEGALGVVSSVPTGNGRPGLIAEARAVAGSGNRVRLVLAGAYMRELGRGDIRCCGLAPGFTYTQETVVLRMGPEWQVLAGRAGALAVDLQYSPIWYHAIRRGSQADFAPSPTVWHRHLAGASFGAGWQWRLRKTLSVRLGSRAYANVPSLAQGAVPRLRLSLTAGFGPW